MALEWVQSATDIECASRPDDRRNSRPKREEIAIRLGREIDERVTEILGFDETPRGRCRAALYGRAIQ